VAFGDSRSEIARPLANDTLKPSGARVEVVRLCAGQLHQALSRATRPDVRVARGLTLGVSPRYALLQKVVYVA
jgi:hypothetical protein